MNQTAAPVTAAHSRRFPRAVGLLAAAALVAVGSYLGPMIHPYSPASAPLAGLPVPGGVVAPDDGTSVTGQLPLAQRIAFWTTRVREQPSDYVSFVQLAVTWSEQGRLRLDLDAYMRATEAVERALAIAPAYAPALIVRGSIRYAIHDFAGAEVDARGALKAAPADPSALAILGDALLEQGRIVEAAATYEQLRPIAGGPAFDIRQARLAYVTGDPSRALDLARKAAAGASGGGIAGADAIDPVQLGFYHFAFGEYARLSGHADLAEAEFRVALDLRSTDLGALLGLARVQAFDGDINGAIGTLQTATAIAPTPEAEALLGDLFAGRAGPGDPAAASAAFGTVRLTQTLSALAGTVYDRILLKFDLDHGAATAAIVDQARAVLANRSDYGAHDLLAWALHRSGQDGEAWSQVQAAMATSVADARTLFHAGVIAAARGDVAAALKMLNRALALGPALDPHERSEAATVRASVTSGTNLRP